MPDITPYVNLPAPKNVSFEQSLDELVGLQGQVVFHESQLVVIRFAQGRVIYHMEKPYGSNAVDKLSERTGIHRDTLKAAERLYAFFGGDEQAFTKWVDEKRRNWTHVLGLIRAEYDPEVLGKDAFSDRLKRRIERLLSDLHEMAELAEEGDDEAMGVIDTAVSEVTYFRNVTAPVLLGSDDLPSITPKSEDYLKFIRTLPCAATGKTPAEPHHVAVGGMGMKGSDYTAIPLSREVHDEIEHRGVRFVEEKYNLRVGSVVAECLHMHLTGVSAALPLEVTTKKW